MGMLSTLLPPLHYSSIFFVKAKERHMMTVVSSNQLLVGKKGKLQLRGIELFYS